MVDISAIGQDLIPSIYSSHTHSDEGNVPRSMFHPSRQLPYISLSKKIGNDGLIGYLCAALQG